MFFIVLFTSWEMGVCKEAYQVLNPDKYYIVCTIKEERIFGPYDTEIQMNGDIEIAKYLNSKITGEKH